MLHNLGICVHLVEMDILTGWYSHSISSSPHSSQAPFVSLYT